MYVVMDPERVRELREREGMRVERGFPVRFPTGRKVLTVFGKKPSPDLGRPISRIPA